MFSVQHTVSSYLGGDLKWQRFLLRYLPRIYARTEKEGIKSNFLRVIVRTYSLLEIFHLGV